MMHRNTPASDSQREAWLVYDGECPFCSAYVKYMRVRDGVGQLHLIDARAGSRLVQEIRAAGYDLNDGMVLKVGNSYYHGADCVHALALLSSRSSLFNRLNAAIFASPRLSRIVYPILRAGRNATLRLLGRTKIVQHSIRNAS
jgi:predicted DCC family thiol-disulfide oxidoreductase YuxK